MLTLCRLLLGTGASVYFRGSTDDAPPGARLDECYAVVDPTHFGNCMFKDIIAELPTPSPKGVAICGKDLSTVKNVAGAIWLKFNYAYYGGAWAAWPPQGEGVCEAKPILQSHNMKLDGVCIVGDVVAVNVVIAALRIRRYEVNSTGVAMAGDVGCAPMFCNESIYTIMSHFGIYRGTCSPVLSGVREEVCRIAETIWGATGYNLGKCTGLSWVVWRAALPGNAELPVGFEVLSSVLRRAAKPEAKGAATGRLQDLKPTTATMPAGMKVQETPLLGPDVLRTLRERHTGFSVFTLYDGYEYMDGDIIYIASEYAKHKVLVTRGLGGEAFKHGDLVFRPRQAVAAKPNVQPKPVAATPGVEPIGIDYSAVEFQYANCVAVTPDPDGSQTRRYSRLSALQHENPKYLVFIAGRGYEPKAGDDQFRPVGATDKFHWVPVADAGVLPPMPNGGDVFIRRPKTGVPSVCGLPTPLLYEVFMDTSNIKPQLGDEYLDLNKMQWVPVPPLAVFDVNYDNTVIRRRATGYVRKKKHHSHTGAFNGN